MNGENSIVRDTDKPNSKADHLAPHRWKPGCPPTNPSGRAPRRRFIEELSHVLDSPIDPADLNSKTKMQAVAEKLVELCLAGNTKAFAAILPHIDPRRVVAGIRAGNVNILSTGLHAEPSEAQLLIDDFVGNTLPGLVAGLSGPERGQAIKAIAYRAGGISAQAGNAFFDKLMRSEVLPVVDQSRE